MSDDTTIEPTLIVKISYRELAALASFLVAAIGSYCHWFTFICILRGFTQRTPFFLFIASQSLAEATLLSCFVFYYPPMVL
ncbi:unnamed protein product [Cylicocyclus nassatus]|uniref:7TM GPCR serpentine receptor class x (Srx) domain-containing protein n=1 Tax=Cylicocyclus nassatus TaxID=53992 RepID=A0AA36GDD9_CYLNA|nr:unnamed protein product [Cylicocyclus nassatus]